MRQRYNSNIEEEVIEEEVIKKRPVKRKAKSNSKIKSKIFKQGGVTRRQSMSEQAEQMVGYQTWNTLDAIEKGEVVSDLVSEGAIVIAMEDGGYMAEGGEVERAAVRMADNPNWTNEKLLNEYNKNKFDLSEFNAGYLKPSKVIGGGYKSSAVAKRLAKEYLEKTVAQYKMALELRGVMAKGGGMMAKGGEIEVGDFVKYKKAKYHATVIDVVNNVDIPYAKIEYSDGMIVRAYLQDLRKIQLGVAEEYSNTELMDRMRKEWNEKHKMADGGMMADGGKTFFDDEYYVIIKNPKGLVTNKGYYGMGYNKKEIIDLFEEKGLKYNEKGEKFGGQALEEYEFFLKKPTKYDIQLPKKMDGGMMAKGGVLSHSDQMIDIMNDEREARMEEGDYDEYESNLKVIRTQFEDEEFEYAEGGGVATEEPIAFVVGYNPKGNKASIKEKSFESKKKAEMFFDMMSEEEDVENIYLKSIYPEAVAIAAAPAPKSLFGAAKSAPKPAASKKEKESVVVSGIADEIARYDELKAIINNAKAEQEVIGGRLKETGVNQYLEIYQERRRNPDTFNLADRDQKIMFIVMDKYKKIEPEKAALLENYDGLIETTTKYSFNPEILDRVGEVVSRIITDSSLLTQQDKDNLIIAETSVNIKKGTIDRLMDYENPVEIFALIEPILALK